MYATGRSSDVHFLPGKPFFIRRQGQAYSLSEDKGIRGLKRRSGFLCPPNNLLSYSCSLFLVGWRCIDVIEVLYYEKKFLTIKNVKLIKKKEFITIVFDLNYKTFIIYKAVFNISFDLDIKAYFLKKT